MRALAVVLALAACADPPAPPAGPDAGVLVEPVPFESYGIAAADAYCAWAVRCRHVPDDTTCRRLLDPKNYDTRRAADGMRLGRLRYDAAAAGRCLAAARGSICPAPPFLDVSCGGVFTGLVPRDGACTTAYDCAGHARCLRPVCGPGCCVGSCGPPEAPVVDPPLAPVGEPCRAHGDCVYTAYCEAGRCALLPDEVGEHCLFGCAVGDLYCDLDTETCRRHPALGEACSPEAKCNPFVAFCDGICKPRPGAGEPCDADARRCVPGTTCDADAGACAARGGEGSACASDGQCEVACDRDAGACAGYSTCAP